MTSKFRVLPWDFFASEDSAPPQLEALQISGAPRTFELLKRGKRVYFRLHADAARLWATLDDSDDEAVSRTFRRAIGSGRFGRVFEQRRGGFNYERGFYFSLLMSARGAVQGREWCATRWFDLRPDSPKLRAYLAANSNLGVFHPKWQPPFREVLENGFALFYEQPFDEAERAWTQQRWVRGDAASLDRITLPFAWQKYPPPVPPHALRTHFYGVWPKSEQPPTSAPVPLKTNHGFLPVVIIDLIAAHFQMSGLNWHCEHDAQRRKFWQMGAPAHAVLTTEPTAHEQLEAQLFVRAWLQDKLAPAQVAEILNFLRP